MWYIHHYDNVFFKKELYTGDTTGYLRIKSQVCRLITNYPIVAQAPHYLVLLSYIRHKLFDGKNARSFLLMNRIKFSDTYLVHMECSYWIRGKLQSIRQCNSDGSVSFCTTRRPVLIALDSSSLLKPCHHHNCRSSEFPNHPPKVTECFL